jgi:hypothetical protein
MTSPTSPKRFDAGYDCLLPDDALDELVAPRRPRILGRPVKGPHGRRLIMLAVLVLVLVAADVVVALVSWQRPAAAPAAAPDPILEHSKALLAAQETQPVPGWQSDGTAYGRAGVIPEVRRAELVPVPRAQQVLRLGRWNQVWMPDGVLTWMRFLGIKDTFADLPKNPQLGDAWGVQEGGQHALWVWSVPVGFTRPVWQDP